jgi:4-amino-4-deoxy-L-arabinose transferase-like glycosyltransferase
MNNIKTFLKEFYLEILIIIFSFLLRIIGINYGLPYSYHTEEYKVVNYALKFGSGDLNPHFFEYPSLYLYFMFSVYVINFIFLKILGIVKSVSDYAILYIKDPTIFYILGRTLSLLFGTAVVIMVGVIANKIFNRKVARISMLLFSVIPSIIFSCKVVRIEMAMIFVSLLYFYYVLKIYEEDKNIYYYIAGVLLGIATSLKYLPIMFIFLVPYISWVKTKKLVNKNVLTFFLVVIIFFVLGTPFSVLDYKTFTKDIKALMVSTVDSKMPSYIVRLFSVIKHYLFINNGTAEKIPFLGILGYIGLTASLLEYIRKKEVKHFLLFSCVIVNIIVVSRHYFPAKGFLFLSFPYFVILSSWILIKIYDKNKTILALFLGLAFIPSFVETLMLDYTFSQKDTRTQALEWIEKNIPYGEKILIDRYPNSPPLRMTKSQLEKLYKKAVELSHYKKEYFYWQLKAHPGGNYGYEVYEVYHPPYEIGTIKHQVEEAQKVRELVDVSVGIEGVKKLGIKYFVYNSYSAETTTEPQIKKFYQEVENKAKLITEFKPKTKFHPGPVIRIYEL